MLWGLICCLIAGLALYLYLPLRALQQPLMNWNDPSTVERFLRSILRRGYGGGLDLLSTQYATGENFNSEMMLYLFHLWRDYLFIGIPLAFLGIVKGVRRQSAWCALAITGWIITGPLFIFLGNLPPNAHAVAIIQAAYLMPDLFFLLLVAGGIAALRPCIPGLGGGAALTLIFVAVGFCNGGSVFSTVNQRQNYLAVDYIHNTYASMPAPSLVVGRSDVPIFSLYYGHGIYPQAPGRIPVAQGLSGSLWYETMMQRNEFGLRLSVLRTPEDWNVLQGQNAGWSLFAANDIDWPSNGTTHFQPRGLVSVFTQPPRGPPPLKKTARILLAELYRYRGTYIYGHYRDFFSNELIENLC